MALQPEPIAGDNSGTGDLDEQSKIERETRERWEPLRDRFTEFAVEIGEEPWAFDYFVERQVEGNRAAYHKARTRDELDSSLVMWDRITEEDCGALSALLDTNPNEQAMHAFLENNPKFLVQFLGGGHGRYYESKTRFGSQYVSDFLVAEESSIGSNGISLSWSPLNGTWNEVMAFQSTKFTMP